MSELSTLLTVAEEQDFWADRSYVSPLAHLEGEIQLSGGCVILAGARLQAHGGGIHLGAFCLIEEYVTIEWTAPQPGEAMVIGAYNHFAAYASLRQLPTVGVGNVWGSFASVTGNGSDGWGSGCVLTPHISVDAAQIATTAGKPKRFWGLGHAPSNLTFLPPPAPLVGGCWRDSEQAEAVKKGEWSVVSQEGTPSAAEKAWFVPNRPELQDQTTETEMKTERATEEKVSSVDYGEEDRKEALRKRCKFYLLTYTWTVTKRQPAREMVLQKGKETLP